VAVAVALKALEWAGVLDLAEPDYPDPGARAGG